MTEDDFKTLTKKVRSEKCDGEITECKLAGFISNYNKKNKRFSVFIERPFIFVNDKITGGSKRIDFGGDKVTAMLKAMFYLVENAKMVIFT